MKNIYRIEKKTQRNNNKTSQTNQQKTQKQKQNPKKTPQLKHISYLFISQQLYIVQESI